MSTHQVLKHYLSSRKCWLKPQWYTTPYLVGWLILKRLKNKQALTRTWSNWNSHPLLEGMQNGTTLANVLAMPFKAKYALWPVNSIPMCLSKTDENMYPQIDFSRNFTAAYFQGVITRKQPKCSPGVEYTNTWLKRTKHEYIPQYGYITHKIMLHERNQISQKYRLHDSI